MLRETLLKILNEHGAAKQEPFAQHPLAQFIRTTAEDDVRAALGAASIGLQIQGSAGAGNWATVPWVAAFDPAVTDSATRGYYVVYLFHENEPTVHLSLNQGTTAVRAEHRRAAREVLQDRARTIRQRLADFTPSLPVLTISLGSNQTLPADYEAGHALGVTYTADAMPPEETLRDDLQRTVAAYRALTFRGGLDPSLEGEELVEDGVDLGKATITEVRQYRYHRRIERNPAAAKLAKRNHGTTCQCCGFNFKETYGELGDGYIEAHHLKPLSALREGAPVDYSVGEDFAVLCANCHRMIHRQPDPSDLPSLVNRVVRKNSRDANK